ncbi:Uncharacterised protein [Delftia tsuruhatensis]|uniref:hypothetical protein n=1 Tax=Delftia tsuruhatensis TaxID=180282 RepID=UPI001E7188B2|nr:hypothetical protein [Delftia tsuruhatensis]CAB5719328.1 Uncharacterised protein [Delftia tsuruhatensis]CAC9687851.1 Uncharacterised protein [Delftia tsuruhatensis]
MSFDVVTHSEVRRLAQSLDKGMGLQLRSRSIWKGEERFVPGIRVGGESPYRMQKKLSPDIYLEQICHTGEVYAGIPIGGNYLYTSTDLKTWTNRSSATQISKIITVGKSLMMIWGGGNLLNSSYLSHSTDNGLSWPTVLNGTSYLNALCGAGIYGFAFITSIASYCYLVNQSGTSEYITLPESQYWRHAFHNGLRYVLMDASCERIYTSNNGKSNWEFVTGLSESQSQAPSNFGNAAVRQPYLLNGRLIIIDVAAGSISTQISDDGVNWRTGAIGTLFGENIHIVEIGKNAAAYNGALYLSARIINGINGESGRFSLLETRDGIRFRLLPSFYLARTTAVEAPPGVFSKNDGTGLIFNSSSNTNGARYEIAPDAKEIYYAL